LATVRIYKVAELLGLSSQEAIDLLKQDTGIDVKSASSSIEEIVARQFVERHARRRQIALPHGPLFADAPAARRPGGKAAKAPEPPKPAAPLLRPRLVKAVKPAATAETHPETEEIVEQPEAAAAHEHEHAGHRRAFGAQNASDERGLSVGLLRARGRRGDDREHRRHEAEQPSVPMSVCVHEQPGAGHCETYFESGISR